MSSERYCLFGTTIGPCGLAWSERGLTRMRLPEADADATERRLRSAGRSPDTPPQSIEAVITKLRDYFEGERADFSSVPVDLGGVSPDLCAIYDALRAVGWGETVSYGELARRADVSGVAAARIVGQAMARNPVPIIIPCHRVLASGQKLGGFSAFGGTVTKLRLLALEGVEIGVDTDAPRLPGI